MLAHITYLSEEAFQRKFGRNLQNKLSLAYGFKTDFQVESYLKHQGQTFVDRFDANSYLYITRAMDYFDLPSQKKGGLKNIYKNTPVKFCVISFTSDWVYPTKYSKEIVDALNVVGANVSFVEIQTDKGHDAFLLDENKFALFPTPVPASKILLRVFKNLLKLDVQNVRMNKFYLAKVQLKYNV